MPTATIRRSVVRGVLATLAMAAIAASSVGQDPVELHVVGRSGDDPVETAEAGDHAR